MQTRVPKSIVKFLKGDRGIPGERLNPSQWVELILSAINRMKGRLEWFEIFKKLSDRQPRGFQRHTARSWQVQDVPCRQEQRIALLEASGFPSDISLNTMVVPVLDYDYESVPADTESRVYLTDSGKLLLWVVAACGFDYKETVTSSSLSFLTAKAMEEHFGKCPNDAYHMYYNICSLAALDADLKRGYAEAAGKLEVQMIALRDRIQDPMCR